MRSFRLTISFVSIILALFICSLLFADWLLYDDAGVADQNWISFRSVSFDDAGAVRNRSPESGTKQIVHSLELHNWQGGELSAICQSATTLQFFGGNFSESALIRAVRVMHAEVLLLSGAPFEISATTLEQLSVFEPRLEVWLSSSESARLLSESAKIPSGVRVIVYGKQLDAQEAVSAKIGVYFYFGED